MTALMATARSTTMAMAATGIEKQTEQSDSMGKTKINRSHSNEQRYSTKHDTC